MLSVWSDTHVSISGEKFEFVRNNEIQIQNGWIYYPLRKNDEIFVVQWDGIWTRCWLLSPTHPEFNHQLPILLCYMTVYLIIWFLGIVCILVAPTMISAIGIYFVCFVGLSLLLWDQGEFAFDVISHVCKQSKCTV